MSFIQTRSGTPIVAIRRDVLIWTGSLSIALTVSLVAVPFGGIAPRVFAVTLFLGIAAIAHLRFTSNGYARFGVANGLTLSRAAGTTALAAFIAAPEILASELSAWMAAAGSAILLALDGVDGWVARARGEASKFGARFDMEVDALTILVLSLLIFMMGKAGLWLVCAGLLRYAFVVAGHVWPILARPLPLPRRRAVCALLIGALTLLLAPIVLPPLSTAIAAVALFMLIWSFGLDLVWLLRK